MQIYCIPLYMKLTQHRYNYTYGSPLTIHFLCASLYMVQIPLSRMVLRRRLYIIYILMYWEHFYKVTIGPLVQLCQQDQWAHVNLVNIRILKLYIMRSYPPLVQKINTARKTTTWERIRNYKSFRIYGGILATISAFTRMIYQCFTCQTPGDILEFLFTGFLHFHPTS